MKRAGNARSLAKRRNDALVDQRDLSIGAWKRFGGGLEEVKECHRCFLRARGRIKTDAAVLCEGDSSRSAWAIAAFGLV